MVKDIPFLIKKREIYYLQKRVPKKLIPNIGREFVRLSLRTKDKATFCILPRPACLNRCMTNAIHQKQARRDTHHYLRAFPDVQNSVTVTLTQKKIVDRQHTDVIVSSDNLRHFMNRLNAAVYGKRFRRFNKHLNVFVLRENSADVRHHLRLMLIRPPSICYEEANQGLIESWLSGVSREVFSAELVLLSCIVIVSGSGKGPCHALICH